MATFAVPPAAFCRECVSRVSRRLSPGPHCTEDARPQPGRKHARLAKAPNTAGFLPLLDRHFSVAVWLRAVESSHGQATPVNLPPSASSNDQHEIARQLNEALGSTLVAALSGERNRKQPHEWTRPDGPEPPPDAWNRVRFAHQIWTTLEPEEGRDVARRWFIGGNPLLGESTPVIAIREDRHAEVRSAAQAFIDGGVDE